MVRKQHLATEIYMYKIIRSIVKLSVFTYISSGKSHFVNEKLTFRIKHTSCVSYYDDVISHDVT